MNKSVLELIPSSVSQKGILERAGDQHRPQQLSPTTQSHQICLDIDQRSVEKERKNGCDSKGAQEEEPQWTQKKKKKKRGHQRKRIKSHEDNDIKKPKRDFQVVKCHHGELPRRQAISIKDL